MNSKRIMVGKATIKKSCVVFIKKKKKKSCVVGWFFNEMIIVKFNYDKDTCQVVVNT